MMRKRWFYIGAALLVLFEVLNVYFIMPFPGSQRLNSLDFAYVLHRGRWVFRVIFVGLMLAGILPAFRARSWRKIGPAFVLAVTVFVALAINTKMQADQIFLAPERVDMQPLARNRVEPRRLVVGVHHNGEARAYPLQFIGYHHQVRDSVGGRPVLVSYCTVCRTGRVFDPVVDGVEERFRLVGMDHFNAMFEDVRTRSWWRQATGAAVTGDAAGKVLAEIPSQQMTLAQWLSLYPGSLIMQPDPQFTDRYPTSYAYESGESRSSLTGTDTVSWSEKAWVVGITRGAESRAYDWNRLRRERVIHDVLGGEPVLIVLASDDASFFAFARPDSATRFTLRNDSLVSSGRVYALDGSGSADSLPPVPASQEFWHSWRTFQPETSRY